MAGQRPGQGPALLSCHTSGRLVSEALTRPLALSKSYSRMTDQLCYELVSLPLYPGELDLELQKADAKHKLSSTCLIKALQGIIGVSPYTWKPPLPTTRLPICLPRVGSPEKTCLLQVLQAQVKVG